MSLLLQGFQINRNYKEEENLYNKEVMLKKIESFIKELKQGTII